MNHIVCPHHTVFLFVTGWCKRQGRGCPGSGEEIRGKAPGGQDSQEDLSH